MKNKSFKITSILVSSIFFLQQSVGYGQVQSHNPSESLRINESRIKAAVRTWSQLKTYGDFLRQLRLKEADRKPMENLLARMGWVDQKLGALYYRSESKTLSFKQGPIHFDLQILEWGPRVVLFDGKKVLAFKPKLTFKEFMQIQSEDLRPQKKGATTSQALPSSKDRLSNSSSVGPQGSRLIEMVLPIAEAQSLSGDYWTAWEAANKKNAEHQSSVAKTCVLAFFLTFALTLGLSYFWGDFFGGSKSSDKEKAKDGGATNKAPSDIDLLKAKHHYPDIVDAVLRGTRRVTQFECVDNRSSTHVRSLKVEGKDSQVLNNEDQIKSRTTQGDEDALFVASIDECCLMYPCGKWLRAQIEGDPDSAAPKVKEVPEFESAQ